MTPRRIVATLLEADDLLPDDSPEQYSPDDIKDIAGQEHRIRPLQGKPNNGFYNLLKGRIDGARRLRPIQNSYDRRGSSGPSGGRGTKVENNTWLLIYPDGTIAVRLHQTDVVTVTPDDTITVNSGDWQTRTTQDRICSWLGGGWGIYTLKGEWYWYNHRNQDFGVQSPDGFKLIQPFTSGDRITADGTLTPVSPPKFVKVRKTRRVAPAA